MNGFTTGSASRATAVTMAVSLGVVLTTGIGVAATKHHSVVACAARGSHVLRLASHGKCGKDRKVTLGTQGPAGPSAAYSVFRSSGPDLSTTTDATVATLSGLPAGAYLIDASAHAFGSSSVSDGGTDAACTVHAGGQSSYSDAYVGSVEGASYNAVLPMMLTHTFATSGTVTLRCTKDLDAPATVSNIRIVATHLGGEHHTVVTH